jgi:hypothetical protein
LDDVTRYGCEPQFTWRAGGQTAHEPWETVVQQTTKPANGFLGREYSEAQTVIQI